MNLDQQPLYTNLKDLIDLAVNHDEEPIEVDCSLTLSIDNIEHQAYTAAIGSREITFYTNLGTVTYFVDLYGTRPVASLYDWMLDSEDQ